MRTQGWSRVVLGASDFAEIATSADTVATVDLDSSRTRFVGNAGRELPRRGRRGGLDGSFAECVGLFEDVSERERVTILVDLLSRKVQVVLDEELVIAA